MRSRVRRLGVVAACLIVALSIGELPVVGQAGRIRLEVGPGSKASYRVREQLAGYDLPNDAVGTTEAVAGSVILLPDGTFDREQSRLTIDLATLTSDQSMRDNYVKNRTLEVAQHPKAEFVPRRAQGLTLPLASSGKTSFELIGDLTVHGVTAETTWTVNGTLAADKVTAQATTRFPFSTFNMPIPKLARLISVDDDIRLELDLVLTRSAVQ